jgi:hypothetical protein
MKNTKQPDAHRQNRPFRGALYYLIRLICFFRSESRTPMLCGVGNFKRTMEIEMKRLLGPFIFCLMMTSTGFGQILLIEDQAGFGALKSVLEGEGYAVTEVNHEYANGFGALMPQAVHDSLEAYIQGGGHLLVTGYDTLGDPADAQLADLVRSYLPFDTFSHNATWSVSNLNHPILNGPYGDFRGQVFEATGYDDDRLSPYFLSEAVELVTSGDPRVTGKIIYTAVGGGSVMYWNGGNPGTTANAQPDFGDGGTPQAIFLNLVYDTAAFRADAGSADVVCADYNEDGFVTLSLDASASRGGSGIVAWQWTWPGGGALGETASVIFPTDGVNRQILLTVTDLNGNTAQDQFNFKPIASPSLYVDLSAPDNPGFALQSAQVSGDTIVVGCGAGNAIEVFRKESDQWVRFSLTAYGPDVHIVDEDTILSLDLSGNIEPTVYRYESGVWGSSVITITPAFTGSSAIKTIASDGQTVVIGDELHLVPSGFGYLGDFGKAFIYNWTGDEWTLAFGRAGVYQSYQERVGYCVGIDSGTVLIGLEQQGGWSLGISEFYKEVDGAWTLVDTVFDDGGDGEFEGFSAYFKNGVLLTGFQTGQRWLSGYPAFAVYEEDFLPESVWTRAKSFDYTRLDEFEAFRLDSDGASFVINYAKREGGDGAYIDGAYIELYQKLDPQGSWLAGAEIRRLSSVDLAGLNDPVLADFSNGLLLISDAQTGIIRAFDTKSDWGLLNVAPIADAGGPYVANSTSWFNGLVVLDGLDSYDPVGGSLTYEWDLDLAVNSDGIGGSADDIDETAATENYIFPIGQTEISLVVVDESGRASAADVTTVTISSIDVDIDIKHGAYPNTINMGSHGVIPVAFLSDESFDATTINPLTVTLRGEDFVSGLVQLRGKKDVKPMASIEDVDGDGDLDLLVKLYAEKLIDSGVDDICVLGALTYDGYVVSGSDTIRAVPERDK